MLDSLVAAAADTVPEVSRETFAADSVPDLVQRAAALPHWYAPVSLTVGLVLIALIGWALWRAMAVQTRGGPQ